MQAVAAYNFFFRHCKMKNDKDGLCFLGRGYFGIKPRAPHRRNDSWGKHSSSRRANPQPSASTDTPKGSPRLSFARRLTRIKKDGQNPSFWCVRRGYFGIKPRAPRRRNAFASKYSSLRRANPCVFSPRRKQKPPQGGLWCTRRGSNPQPSASEADTLSNCATSAYSVQFYLL